MGLYLDPPGNKLEFLITRARCITPAQASAFTAFGTVDQELICLIDNGAFYAAGVAFDTRERNRFLAAADDGRHYTWYFLPHSALDEAATPHTLLKAYRESRNREEVA